METSLYKKFTAEDVSSWVEIWMTRYADKKVSNLADYSTPEEIQKCILDFIDYWCGHYERVNFYTDEFDDFVQRCWNGFEPSLTPYPEPDELDYAPKQVGQVLGWPTFIDCVYGVPYEEIAKWAQEFMNFPLSKWPNGIRPENMDTCVRMIAEYLLFFERRNLFAQPPRQYTSLLVFPFWRDWGVEFEQRNQLEESFAHPVCGWIWCRAMQWLNRPAFPGGGPNKDFWKSDWKNNTGTRAIWNGIGKMVSQEWVFFTIYYTISALLGTIFFTRVGLLDPQFWEHFGNDSTWAVYANNFWLSVFLGICVGFWFMIVFPLTNPDFVDLHKSVRYMRMKTSLALVLAYSFPFCVFVGTTFSVGIGVGWWATLLAAVVSFVVYAFFLIYWGGGFSFSPDYRK